MATDNVTFRLLGATIMFVQETIRITKLSHSEQDFYFLISPVMLLSASYIIKVFWILDDMAILDTQAVLMILMKSQNTL